MTEFNKEETLNAYIEAVLDGDDNKANEVAASLPEDMDQEGRINFIKDLIAALKEKDNFGGLEKEIKQLEQTIKIIESLEYYSDVPKDSTGEEGKDDSEPEEATQDVAADTSAEAAENSSEDATDSEAPAEEVKTEKSEQ